MIKLTILKNSEKSFGYLFSLIFLLIFVFLKKKISITFLFLSIILLIITIFKSSLLKKPYIFWLKFGLLLNKIFSPLILGLIFYFLVTPIGLIMKLFNYDPLQLKNTNENTSSFWLKSSVKKSSMKNQF